MKNQWPFWLFIIAIAVVVVVAMNYTGQESVAPLGEAFPPDSRALDYEYVFQQNQQIVPESVQPVSEPVAEPKSVASVPVAATVTPAAQPQVQAPAASTTTAYAIQILASKDLKATEAELQKVKNNGFADAYIRNAELGDKGTWNRIYVGQFSSMAQAQEALPKVKQKYPQAFIFKF